MARFEDKPGSYTYKCPNCTCEIEYSIHLNHHICPKCGTRMHLAENPNHVELEAPQKVKPKSVRTFAVLECEKCKNLMFEVPKGQKCTLCKRTVFKSIILTESSTDTPNCPNPVKLEAPEPEASVKHWHQCTRCDQNLKYKQTTNAEGRTIGYSRPKIPFELLDLDFAAAMCENWAAGIKDGRKDNDWQQLTWDEATRQKYIGKTLRHLYQYINAENPEEAKKHAVAVACNANILWRHESEN